MKNRVKCIILTIDTPDNDKATLLTEMAKLKHEHTNEYNILNDMRLQAIEIIHRFNVEGKPWLPDRFRGRGSRRGRGGGGYGGGGGGADRRGSGELRGLLYSYAVGAGGRQHCGERAFSWTK